MNEKEKEMGLWPVQLNGMEEKEKEEEKKVTVGFHLGKHVIVTPSKIDVRGAFVTLENGKKAHVLTIDVYADGMSAVYICDHESHERGIIDVNPYTRDGTPGRLSCVMPVLDKKTGEKTYNGGLPQPVKLSDIIDADSVLGWFKSFLDKKPNIAKSDNTTDHSNGKEKVKSK